MKPLLVPLVLLCASHAHAVSPTPISFETIVTLDKFRITNTSPSAHLHELIVRPSANITPTVSNPSEMLLANTPPWPGDDRIGWFITRFRPGEWMEFTGTWAAGSMLSAQFAEPFTQSRGFIFAPIENGTFEGWTVPEASSVVLMLVGVAACGVAWKRRRDKR